MRFSLCLTAEVKPEVNSHKLHENLQLRSWSSSGRSLWLLLDCPALGSLRCRTAGQLHLGPWLLFGCSWGRWVSSWRLAQLACGQHPQSFPALSLLEVELSTSQKESSAGSPVQHVAVTGEGKLVCLCRWMRVQPAWALHSCISQT